MAFGIRAPIRIGFSLVIASPFLAESQLLKWKDAQLLDIAMFLFSLKVKKLAGELQVKCYMRVTIELQSKTGTLMHELETAIEPWE